MDSPGSGPRPESVSVVLVDDHQMVREALAQVLGDHADIEVLGQAEDRRSAALAVEAHRPDVLVLDYSIPGGALPLIELLAGQAGAPRVIVLTVHESIHYAVRVLEAGAMGFVVKAAATEELIAAIHSARRGEVFISRRVSGRVIEQLRRPRKERTGLAALSARELELLRLLGAGLGLQEAAQRLGVSPSTASTYRARLLEKLSLEGTAGLIRFAIEHDVVG